MKNGLLLVFLLGYGYLAPFQCGKEQAAHSKKESNMGVTLSKKPVASIVPEHHNELKKKAS